MPKSDLSGKSVGEVSEVESESILTDVFALLPQAEKVYGEIETFVASPEGQQDIADAKALFTTVLSIIGPVFHITPAASK